MTHEDDNRAAALQLGAALSSQIARLTAAGFEPTALVSALISVAVNTATEARGHDETARWLRRVADDVERRDPFAGETAGNA